MTLEERRWTEIEFFYLCDDIYNIQKNMRDVTYIIAAVAQITPHSNRMAVERAAAIIYDYGRGKPNEDEFLYLAEKNNIPKTNIARHLGKHRTTLYHRLKKEDPIICPKLDEKDTKYVREFLDLWKKLKGTGRL